ncbi:MAG: DUF6152 family protein [Pseudomonadota bacterium]
MKLIKLLSAGVGLGLLAQVAFAHHSTNGIYDEKTEVELTGKVKAWRFINPHPSLILEVNGADGKVQEWDISYGGSAVTHLMRRGYTAETFKDGDELTFKGNPAKVEGAYGLLVRGNPVRPDGTSVPAAAPNAAP